MRRFLFTLAISLLCHSINAQIVGPDTVCVGTSEQFTTPYEASYYTWTPDTVNINQPISPGISNTVIGNVFNTACFSTINYDNGNYYSFVISYSSNNVYKLSYGNSPLNTPTLQTLGTFGLNSGQTDGIDIAKDSITGNWYAFILGGSQFLRLDFGNSLANSPTPTMMSYPAFLAWPHQIFLKKQNNQWMLFVANRAGGVSRFDFGTSLANTPIGNNLTSVGGINQPVGFFLFEQGTSWYMIVLNLINNTLTRLNFGSDLQNNTPSGVNLGNPGNMLSLPRGSSLIADCNQLLGYIVNEGGSLIKLDFHNNITNAPIASLVGSTGITSNNNLISFTFNNSLYWLRTNASTSLYRTKVLDYPAGTSGGYNNSTFSHTFTQPGVYNITLHCDQGTVQGPASFCKQVVVVSSGGNVTLNDTTVCATSYVLNSNIVGQGNSILWNTGATTPSITVTSSGAYWVTSSGGCITGSDTATITLQTPINVDLGNDQAICAGQSATLQSTPSFTGASHLWSTGSGNPTLNVNQAGTYWLQVTQGVCTDADTINITLQNPPTLQLGNDTIVCNSTYTITPSVTDVQSYLWSTGATTPSITVNSSGLYWVVVSNNCGIVRDSINVTLLPQLSVNIGPDTTICAGQLLILQAQGNYVNPTFLWNTGGTTSSTNATTSGTYWIQINEGPCSATDTATITILDPPLVDLGADRSYCAGGSLALQSSVSYTNAGYLWSTFETSSSITVSQPGTYWLTVSLLPGCSGSDTVDITEVPLPMVTINNDTVVCPGIPVVLTAQGNFNTPAYLWNTGSTAPGITATQAGIYWLQVTVNGCSAGDSMNISHWPEPIVDIYATDSICEGSTVTLTSAQPANSQYLWSNGNTTENIEVGAGEYWLTVTNAYGCTATDSTSIHYYPVPYVILPSDTSVCLGEQLYISALSYHGTLLWNNGSTGTMIPVTEEGLYYVTASNVCESVSDSFYLDTENCDLWVPNVFTPNQDGKNDVFRIRGNLAYITDLTFRIYNRWGECVFDTRDVYAGWDGTFRNNNQDVGTFAYLIQCKAGSRSIFMKGFFHLLK